MTTQLGMTRRLASIYRQATDDQRATGHGWYPAALATAQAIGAPLAAVMPLAQITSTTVAAMAQVSPRCPWSLNLDYTRRLVAARVAGSLVAPAVSTLSNRNTAWRILSGADPESTLRGPKVRAFYAAVMGDTTAVPLDVWAVAAVTPGWTRAERERYVDTVAGRRTMLSAYTSAARAVGAAPRDLQAVVWMATRTDSQGHKIVRDSEFHAVARRMGVLRPHSHPAA